MKNIIKLLALMLVLVLAVSIFVACDDTGDTGGTGGGGGSSAGGTGGSGTGGTGGSGNGGSKTEFTVVFKIQDPSGKKLDEGETREGLSRGDEAVEPYDVRDNIDLYEDWVVIGWDCDGDGEADELYLDVTEDLTAVSVVRAKKIFDIELQDKDGNKVTTIQVKESKPLIADDVELPAVKGMYHSGWTNVTTGSTSTIEKIVDQCVLKASYSEANAIVPMISKNTITVDGVIGANEPYYQGAYLPINNLREVSSGNDMRNLDPEDVMTSLGQTYNEYYATIRSQMKGSETLYRCWSDATGWAWLLWDGDYVYLMAEISDTSLIGRSPWFLGAVANAYMNDNIELWYSFEQDYDQEFTAKKIAAEPFTAQKYKIDRTKSSAPGQTEPAIANNAYSTHYSDIKLGASIIAGDDGYAEDGSRTPTYRVEMKIPARTEGVADVANHPNVDPVTGYNGPSKLEAGGDKQYADALKQESNYAFTDGKALKVGNYIRLSLQLNDLMIKGGMATLGDPNSACHENDTLAQEKKETFAGGNEYWLFTKNAEGEEVEVLPWLSPKGQTQYDTTAHLVFTLGGDSETANNVFGLTYDQDTLTKAEVDAYNATEDGLKFPIAYSPNLQ